MPPTFFEYSFATPGLGALVCTAWGASYGSGSDPMPGIIAPDAHVEFLFQTGAPCATLAAEAEARPSPRAMIFGLRHGALQLRSTGANSIIGFRVPPAVASVILGRPLAECWDQPVALTDLIGPEARDLLDRIAEVPLSCAGTVLETWLLARLNDWNGDDTRNLELQNTLMWRVGGEPVSALADDVGVTLRTLRRHCEKYSGLSPKQLVMSGRMLRACADLLDRREMSITNVAHNMGFGDQPAFTNAFRHYVGMTPANFRAEPVVHCERFRA